MRISDKTYKLLKWLIGIVLPAALTLFGVIGHTLDFSCTEVVLTIGAAVITFLGTITGITTVAYNLEKKAESLISEAEIKNL